MNRTFLWLLILLQIAAGPDPLRAAAATPAKPGSKPAPKAAAPAAAKTSSKPASKSSSSAAAKPAGKPASKNTAPAAAKSGSKPVAVDTKAKPVAKRRPLSQHEARKLFLDMGKRAARDGFSPDFKADGCFWKAHKYELAARDFVRGDGSKIAGHDIRRIHLVPGKKSGIGWEYHTAVTIPVLDDRGKPQDMVFDPALYPSGPRALKPWAEGSPLLSGQPWRRDDKAMDRPRARDEAYVSVVPGSTTNRGHIVPPYFGNEDSSKTENRLEATAEDIFSRFYGGARRYVWKGQPREPVRLVFR